MLELLNQLDGFTSNDNVKVGGAACTWTCIVHSMYTQYARVMLMYIVFTHSMHVCARQVSG